MWPSGSLQSPENMIFPRLSLGSDLSIPHKYTFVNTEMNIFLLDTILLERKMSSVGRDGSGKFEYKAAVFVDQYNAVAVFYAAFKNFFT